MISYDFPNFVDPTPDDPIDKDDIVIFQLEQFNSHSLELKTSVDALKTSFDNQLELDYTSNFSDLVTSQNTFIERLDSYSDLFNNINAGANTVTTYGTLYVPLIFVTMMLWWFFKQFIR